MIRQIAVWWLPLAGLLGLCLATLRPQAHLPKTANGRVIVDARSTAVCVPEPSRGTALLFPPTMGEYFEVTNAPEGVVAVTTISPGLLSHSLLSVCLTRLPQLARDRWFPTPHAVNLEAMLHLDPSAIVMASFLAEPLDRVGLPVIGVMSAGNEGGIVKNARLFADIAGVPGRGQLLTGLWQHSLQNAQAALGENPQKKPRVLDLTISADGSLRASGRRGLAQRLLTRAGGENVITADLAAVRLSPEQILDLDPEVVLLSIHSSVTPEEFVSQRCWSCLTAVARRQVYRQPEGAVLSTVGVVESSLYLRWLMEVFHPDVVPPGAREIVREAYRQALGVRLDEDQIDRALSVPANGTMANYARFCAKTEAKAL